MTASITPALTAMIAGQWFTPPCGLLGLLTPATSKNAPSAPVSTMPHKISRRLASCPERCRRINANSNPEINSGWTSASAPR
jgi:hypothetical protein